MKPPATLFSKIWDRHVVAQKPGHPAALYIDQLLLHEVTSPQAFDILRERELPVRRPERALATMDHSIPTTEEGLRVIGSSAAAQLEQQ